MSKHSSRGTEWEALRQRVLQRDGFQCQLRYDGCTGTATQVDHVISRANGGLDTLDNTQAACQSCNNYKGSKPVTRRNWLNPRYFTA